MPNYLSKETKRDYEQGLWLGKQMGKYAENFSILLTKIFQLFREWI